MVDDLMLCAVLVFTVYYWWSASGIREIALAATKFHCQNMDVQLLDECIVLNRLWFKRDEMRKIRVWRSYRFEFTSTGDSRYHGRIILLGSKILSIQLDPYRFKDFYPD